MIARCGVEEVGRTGVGAVVVVPGGPDDGGGTADHDGPAEPVVRRAVVGQELEELVAEVGVGGGCPANEAETNRSDRWNCEA